MSQIFTAAIVGLTLSLAPMAQDEGPKPIVSKNALTAEQVAVYRAVLRNYTNGTDNSLNVANRTVPLPTSGPFSSDGCVKDVELKTAESSVPVIHLLDSRVVSDLKMVLVDAEQQKKAVDDNDPQKLMNKANDDRETVTEKQLDDSLALAFKAGLFTLSEIIFDKQHRHAMVSYSFICGGLCGHGNTLALRKVGQKWRVSKTCGSWIS
jgi:hypothetical protein